MQRLILCLLGVTLASPAQTPPTVTPPGVPQPPAPRPLVAPPGVPEAGNAIQVEEVDPNLVLREDQVHAAINGDALAELYRKFTGRRVTVSRAAAAAEFRFIQAAPMTYGEATQLLKKAALLEGFVFVPDANMDGHDVLVVATGGPNPKGEGIEVIIDPMDLPNDDRIVSYVMNLKVIKPDEIVRTFTTVVGQFGAYGSITPVPNAGAVVITEKTSLIRRLIELQEQIDVSSTVATRFIKVRYADVETLAETLNEILNTQQQNQGSAGVQRVGNNNGGPPTPQAGNNAASAAGSSNAAEEVPIQIIADSRTNRIFAMGRPVDIIFIEGLVAEFDTQTDERNFLRRKLRFVTVSDFLEIAEPALQRAFSGSSTANGGSTGANFGGNSRNTQASNRTSNSSNSTSTGTGSSIGSSSGLGTSSLSDPGLNNAPEARLVGRTLLVADNITNSLVVQGPPASVEIITNLLDEIDVKAEQVMISAVFGQLTLGEDFSFGVDYAQALGGDNFAGRAGSGLFPEIPLDGTSFDPGSLAASAGLSMYGQIGDDFNVIVSALQSDSRFKVLSRPTIFTANNRLGTIQAGERIAIPTSTNQFNDSFSTNIEYQDVLLSLEVIPLVNSKDEVTLDIALLNDEVIGEQFIENVGEVPTIGRRELVTNVTVPDGSTIVLGGLIISRQTESVSGVPILSDIPYLGKLFSSTETNDDRAELMVFIQPRIVSDSESLYDSQTDMDSRYRVTPEVQDFARGPGVLPSDATVAPVTQKGSVPQAIIVDEEPEEKKRRFGNPARSWRR
ncbi:MAG: secretin N-terminal domain-containing protein [Verrucomicrobiales bacterium]